MYFLKDDFQVSRRYASRKLYMSMGNKSLRENCFVCDAYLAYYDEKLFTYLWIVM
jgi:hypothetical protein